MFNSNVSSISCGGLDFFDGAVDFSDLAFMELVKCMQESDNALSCKMKEIRGLNEAKRSITRDIERLTEAMENSEAEDDDDKVTVYGSLDDPAEHQETIGQYQEGENQVVSRTCQECTKIEVQNKIEELRNQLEDLNTSSSVMMIDLQRLMNKRNEAVQLVSNIEAKSHQTAMSVIANLK